MPSSRILIASNTLGSAAASVTFSGIPATYTDLVVRASIRGDNADYYDNVKITLNNSSSTIYSLTRLEGYGTSSGSTNQGPDATYWNAGSISAGATATSNTFSSVELYLSNYAGSTNKVASEFGVQESNSATNNNLVAGALLWRSTSAITTIKFETLYGSNWVSGSSFFLYGIKNS
jgi:hypothetical protein